MAALIQSRDWAATPLGPVASWPQSLRSVLRILVTSRYAMWLGWGAGLTFFYNDAYARMTLGAKHPWALGRRASEVWQEIWQDIGPRAEAVMSTGQATWDEGLLLFLERSGFPEETYHTFSYSPLPDDHGGVGGMLCVVAEDTDRVIGERRLATLRELAALLGAVRTEPDVLAAIAEGLSANQRDMPFTAMWLFDAECTRGRLSCVTAIEAGHSIAPRELDLTTLEPDHPAALICAGSPYVLVKDLARYGVLPTGAWDRQPHLAVAVPIAQQGQSRPAGVLLAALNPYRPFAEPYLGFLVLVAAQIASGLASARAYEAERQRAEALAEIDRAKTAFFSNVSHEFRTPLTLMLGPLEEEIAERGGLAERLTMVHRNGLRLLRLVNTLLDFSRIEAGRVRAAYRPTDLALYTAQLASNFRSACERAGLTLSVDCPPLPEPVYVDADMWERVVLNLVSNAFKYTLTGGIRVEMRAIADDRVELVVSDTGVGISAHELPRIFDRFHRIEGQIGRTMEGTGIGLALVNELIHLHGGAINVESKPGVGTAVHVRLPLGHAHLPAAHVSQARGRTVPEGVAAASFVAEAMRWLPEVEEFIDVDNGILDATSTLVGAGDERTDDAKRSRILLADDNADMRDYVERLLGAQYVVRTAEDGEAALVEMRRERPDLVLSDVMMPRLDGYGLLAANRAEPGFRDLPVILLSARAGDEARVDGLDAGADDYLVKPFASRELMARVRANLELARLRREAADQLRSLNENLERRVAQEIAERMRAEEALRQAQKMEAVGQLTGGVAHDFNNLLTAICGGADTLRRLLPEQLGPEEVRLRRAVRMIEDGAQRAATLTQRLLAFGRRQALDPRPLDANKLVSGMSELLRRTLGEVVAIEIVLAGGLWRTMADPNQLESALLNLAVNARDAMPGGGRLTIETANTFLDEAYSATHPEVLPGQYVLIAVSDTGTGIQPDIVERVFEPFFTTKEVGQGTGLGLSQVYGFIKQSCGHVKIYSEPGQGTAVKLYLPRLIADTSAAAELDDVEAEAQMGSGELILVVEDDEDVRGYSVEALRELGYRVVAAANGTTGLELLARYPAIRLLFTDVGLPGGMTGRQLADQARTRRPDLQVLFTTGYARNAIVHGGVLDPGTHLLPKPFTLAALAAKVSGMLGE
jgi:signal transduction histidine kinase